MTYHPRGDTVTITTPGEGEPDEYGILTPTNTTPRAVAGVAVAPGDTRELTQGQATVEVDFTLYFVPPVTIDPHAVITVRGLDCEVEGRPKDYVNPWTGFAGTEVAVRRSR